MDKIPGNSVIREFEYKIAEYCGAKNCLSICNATVGILGVFYALGLSNAEVISTPLTWSGSFSGLKMLNCKIRFCDIEHPTLTINPDKIESLITPNTKAVFSADFLGYPARLDKISEICKKRNLLLIHDAASSFGSRYKGYYSGYFADVSIISFGIKKIFSTGEGGCILTENDRIYENIINFLMHPVRQEIEGFEGNPFALNTNLNPIGANYALDSFDHNIYELEIERKKSIEWMKKKQLPFNNTIIEPNYYKILLHKDEINKSVKSRLINDLPFKNLIYSESAFFDNIDANQICPIAENALHQYKTITMK